MITRLLTQIAQNARALDELYAFHRAEMREAGVTDDQLNSFLLGR